VTVTVSGVIANLNMKLFNIERRARERDHG